MLASLFSNRLEQIGVLELPNSGCEDPEASLGDLDRATNAVQNGFAARGRVLIRFSENALN